MITRTVLGLYLMNEVPICIFSHFAIEPRTFLDISDHSYEMEMNWLFGGIVYFHLNLDSARSIMLQLIPFLKFLHFSGSLAFETTIHDRDQ